MALGERSDWRELCAAAAKEEDSVKLGYLVNQIIRALGGRIPSDHSNHSTGVTSTTAA